MLLVCQGLRPRRPQGVPVRRVQGLADSGGQNTKLKREPHLRFADAAKRIPHKNPFPVHGKFLLKPPFGILPGRVIMYVE